MQEENNNVDHDYDKNDNDDSNEERMIDLKMWRKVKEKDDLPDFQLPDSPLAV